MSNKQKTSKTSKGERKNVSSSRKSGAKKYNTPLDRILNQFEAYENGRNVMITIPNPDPSQTNRLYIRVPARSLYGDPRKRDYLIIK